MRIVLVGGGTGGHFYPLIAVAESLHDAPERPELYYFGPDEYDAEALKTQQITFVYCPAGKVRRYFSIANFTDLFKSLYGVLVALYKLFAIYPDVVFSKGGYTSVPVVLAAKLLFIPIVIHESDSVPGRSSRLAAKLARYVGIAYDEVASYFPPNKTALVGIPIRRAIRQRYDKAEARAFLNIPNDKPLIYVTGGSSGAERLNNQIVDALPQLLQSVRVFHQVGQTNIPFVQERVQIKLEDKQLLEHYYLQGYLNQETVAMVLSAADIVITRAGSTTLFEIAQHETPAILVPIPESISHDQRTNAYAYAREGAAIVIEEDNISYNLLIQEINNILTDEQRYQQMVVASRSMQYPDAADKIAHILISIGKEHGS
jgi:UDP-N-acetylglucosamine--N-acetylmuramyl-(pentapeptide) pyrophosphoryl-undecaprenol N-acetylglucosamine transferase